MKPTCLLSTFPEHQRVIVRADLNVPITNGRIINNLRLRGIQPTLDALIAKRATTVLLTHLGRPKGKDPALSTHQLIPWFKQQNYTVTFAQDIETALQKVHRNDGSIILLENLRFFPGEKENSNSFAQELAQLGQYFVQDAFGALHKHETSITLLPEQFQPNNRTIGLLVEKELSELSPLIDNPSHPFCVILGGEKVSDKIPLITHMQNKADAILLCPALVFTFLKSQGKDVGTSLVDDTLLDTCKQILAHNRIHLPIDYQVAQQDKDGILSYTATLSKNDMGIAIGPKTVQEFSKQITQAKIIFYNGAMGFNDKPETQVTMKALFQAMSNASGKSIIAGGDSTAAYQSFGLSGISYLSTGGGAALAYLSGSTLPGLMPFLKK